VPVGVKELINGLKKERPYLFKVGSAKGGFNPSPNGNNVAFDSMSMADILKYNRDKSTKTNKK